MTMWLFWDRFRPITAFPIGSLLASGGARPFRRAPHTGFFTASYCSQPDDAAVQFGVCSRSDDSDFLAGDDSTAATVCCCRIATSITVTRNSTWREFPLADWVGIYALPRTDQQSAHRSHRLCEPAHQRPSRAEISMGQGKGECDAVGPAVETGLISACKGEPGCCPSDARRFRFCQIDLPRFSTRKLPNPDCYRKFSLEKRVNATNYP